MFPSNSGSYIVRSTYYEGSYSVLYLNCTSFCNDLSRNLCNTPIPSYTRNLMKFGQLMASFVPSVKNHKLLQIPPEDDEVPAADTQTTATSTTTTKAINAQTTGKTLGTCLPPLHPFTRFIHRFTRHPFFLHLFAPSPFSKSSLSPRPPS